MATGQEMIVCVMISEGSVQCNGTTFTKAELLKDTSAMFWVYLCVYIVLVLFAGQLTWWACIKRKLTTVGLNFRSDVGADDGSSLS